MIGEGQNLRRLPAECGPDLILDCLSKLMAPELRH
jgi:hypothetical protein